MYLPFASISVLGSESVASDEGNFVVSADGRNVVVDNPAKLQIKVSQKELLVFPTKTRSRSSIVNYKVKRCIKIKNR